MKYNLLIYKESKIKNYEKKLAHLKNKSNVILIIINKLSGLKIFAINLINIQKIGLKYVTYMLWSCIVISSI